MKKMLLILVLVMLMPFVHAESELYASDPRIQELYEYSKAQADISEFVPSSHTKT